MTGGADCGYNGKKRKTVRQKGEREMKRVLKLCVAVVAWLLFELLFDGSGIDIKRRWEKIKAWAGYAGEKRK